MMKATPSRVRLPLVIGTLGLLLAALPTPASACEEVPVPHLSSLKIARRIVERAPVQTGKTAVADGRRVYVHMTFAHTGDAQPVRVLIKRNGKPYYVTTVKVGKSKAWHTWVYFKAHASNVGSYQVEVLDTVYQAELGKQAFEVVRATAVAKK